MNLSKTSEPASRQRLSLFPLREDERLSWNLYLKQEANSWSVSEVSLSSDIKEYEHLSEIEKRVWDITAAFFVVGDRPIVTQLATCKSILKPDDIVKEMFLDSQARIEGVHMHMYGLFVKTIISDPVKRRKLQNAVSEYESIRLKVEAIQKYQKPGQDPRLLLLSQVCSEGISFSSPFALVNAFAIRGKMKGFAFGNNLVMKDEFLHCNHANGWLLEFESLEDEVFYDVVRDFVAAEDAFSKEALGDHKMGIVTKEKLMEYTRMIADIICTNAGKTPLYGITNNPLPFMDISALKGVVNFFELTNPEYKRLTIEDAARNLDLRFRKRC